MDWLCATCLEFPDRYEGQVLCIGSEEDCRKTGRLIDALTYSGSEKILSSQLLIMPNEQGLEAGVHWVHSKEVGNE